MLSILGKRGCRNDCIQETINIFSNKNENNYGIYAHLEMADENLNWNASKNYLCICVLKKRKEEASQNNQQTKDSTLPLTPCWFIVFLWLYLSGSGVPVKKWMQGKLESWGKIETMLAVVRNSPSILMPLGLSRRISIIVSKVMFPKKIILKIIKCAYICRLVSCKYEMLSLLIIYTMRYWSRYKLRD